MGQKIGAGDSHSVPRRLRLLLCPLQIGPSFQHSHQFLQRSVDAAMRQTVRGGHLHFALQPHDQTQPVGRLRHPIGRGDLLAAQLRHPHLSSQQIRQRRGLLFVVGFGRGRVRPRRSQSLLHRFERLLHQHQSPVRLRRLHPHLLLAAP